MSDNVNFTIFETKINEIIEKKMRSGGGSGYNSDMWEQTVETRLSQLHSDIKGLRNFLLIAYATGFLVLLGAFAQGYDRIDSRIDDVANILAKIEAKLEK